MILSRCDAPGTNVRSIGGTALIFGSALPDGRSEKTRTVCLSGKFGDEGGDCDGSVVNTSCAEEQRKRRDVSTSARGAEASSNMKNIHGK